jgi:acyl-CoA thioesterase-2
VTAPSFDEILKIEQVGEDLFEGATAPGAFAAAGPAIYGGQLVAQALLAAGKTAPDKIRHSLHAYYARPGDVALPVTYQVVRVRDGRSFSTRQVTARQRGAVVLLLIASFKHPEAGPAHQGEMPKAPPPDDPKINTGRPFWPSSASDGMPMELRRIVPEAFPAPPNHPPVQRFWFRARGPIAGGEALQAAALAYISDIALLATPMLPHGNAFAAGKGVSSSIDHALWFHRPTAVGEWHLYDQMSPTADDARGFALGSIWRADGTLVATTAQEGVMRSG